jgi:hypothetical protein
MQSYDKEVLPDDFKDSQSVLNLIENLGKDEIMTTKLPELALGTFGTFQWKDGSSNGSFSCGRCKEFFPSKKERTKHPCTVCKYCGIGHSNRQVCATHENTCSKKNMLRGMFGVYVKPSNKIGYNTFCWQEASFYNKLLLPKSLEHTRELSGLKFFIRIYLPAYVISMSTFHERLSKPGNLRDPGIPFLDVNGNTVPFEASTNCTIINRVFREAVSAETAALKEQAKRLELLGLTPNTTRWVAQANNNIANGTATGSNGKGMLGVRNRVSNCLLALHSKGPNLFSWSSRPPSCEECKPPTIDMKKFLHCMTVLSRCRLTTIDTPCAHCKERPESLNTSWGRFAFKVEVVKWINSEQRYNGRSATYGPCDEVCCDCALLYIVKETVCPGFPSETPGNTEKYKKL